MITLEQVKQEIVKLDKNAVNPFYMDNSLAPPRRKCIYTDNKNHHCIAGQVLANLGVMLPPISSPDNNLGVHDLARASQFQFDIEDEALLILRRLQAAADIENVTWGKAIDEVMTA